MKKADELRKEYRREDLGRGVRGKSTASTEGNKLGAAATGDCESIPYGRCGQ